MVIGMTELSSAIRLLQDPGSYSLTIILGKSTAQVLLQKTSGNLGTRYFLLDKGLEPELVEETFSTHGKDLDSVRLFTGTARHTLVPNGLHLSESNTEYLNILFGEQRGQVALDVAIPSLSTRSVFELEKGLYEAVKLHLPQASISHLSHVLLLGSLNGRQHGDGKTFRAHLHEDVLFTYCLEGKDLSFFNRYMIGDSTDIVFHCLSALEALKIDYGSADVRLSGALTQSAEGTKLLKDYCKNCEVIEDKVLGVYQEADHYVLSHAPLCAS